MIFVINKIWRKFSQEILVIHAVIYIPNQTRALKNHNLNPYIL